MQGAYIDPKTKDYILSSGQILNEDLVLSMINMRLFCPYGSYMFDQTFGCKIYSRLGATGIIVNRRTLEKDIEVAVQDMITSGYIKTFTAICTSYTLSTASFVLIGIQINNEEIKFNWSISI